MASMPQSTTLRVTFEVPLAEGNLDKKVKGLNHLRRLIDDEFKPEAFFVIRDESGKEILHIDKGDGPSLEVPR